jgi:hypothetical protein
VKIALKWQKMDENHRISPKSEKTANIPPIIMMEALFFYFD